MKPQTRRALAVVVVLALVVVVYARIMHAAYHTPRSSGASERRAPTGDPGASAAARGG